MDAETRVAAERALQSVEELETRTARGRRWEWASLLAALITAVLASVVLGTETGDLLSLLWCVVIFGSGLIVASTVTSWRWEQINLTRLRLECDQIRRELEADADHP